jgi:hypothetical protein
MVRQRVVFWDLQGAVTVACSVLMNGCIAESDFQEMGRACLENFDRRLPAIPEDLCAPFHDQAGQLETGLLFLYKATVMCVRREADIERVAKRWGDMVSMCTLFLAKLKTLHEKHPRCGAEIYYDRVLDLRNKCQRLQEMHE